MKLTGLFLRRKIAFRVLGAFILVSMAWLLWPPAPPFPSEDSLIVTDRHGEILRVFLARDQQLRFPPSPKPFPEKYRTALLQKEDRRFRWHPGVDPMAMLRAVYQNLRAGKRISGGSTLTMQVMRMAGHRPRTFANKAVEIAQALRLTLHASKDSVLRLYAAQAPMGSNIVGVEAAAFGYFGKPGVSLTWAEAALLAVLPQNPAFISLERGRLRLLKTRDRLLRELHAAGHLDQTTLELALAEPLPKARGTASLPLGMAPHFTDHLRRLGGGWAPTTLDAAVQTRLNALASAHQARLMDLGIGNLSVLIVEVRSGEVRGWLGSADYRDRAHQGQVDGVLAPRSPGSTLKPFLLAQALDRGPWFPASKVADVPTYYGTFSPQNAGGGFSGVTRLDEALLLSLNVPFARLLRETGVEDFHSLLRRGGLRLSRPPENYGLALILGACEASLWELMHLYLALGHDGVGTPLRAGNAPWSGRLFPTVKGGDTLFSDIAAGETRSILRRVVRPEAEMYWMYFDNQVPVYWKTGTSHGQKDAWAMGLNAEWAIGVWAGNFDGEGNPSLMGARSAAPLLFQLFRSLSRRGDRKDIPAPIAGAVSERICAASGWLAGAHCPASVPALRPDRAYVTRLCPYHRTYLFDRRTGRAVCSLCWKKADTAWVTRLVWTPAMRAQLQRLGRKPDEPPRHNSLCPTRSASARPEIIYPQPGSRIFPPRDYGGEREKAVFEAASAVPLYWWLDGNFLARTEEAHKAEAVLTPGPHELVVEDEDGSMAKVGFESVKPATP